MLPSVNTHLISFNYVTIYNPKMSAIANHSSYPSDK